MTPRGRVAVVGSVNADLVVRVPRFPAPGETLPGGDLVVSGGGKSANQAVAAARLGARVALVGAVGSDHHGTTLKDSLVRDGIDVAHLSVKEGASGTAVVLVDEAAENVIVVSPGANGHLAPEDVEEAADAIAGAAVLGLALEVPPETVLAAARLAHESGTRVVLNPSPWRELEPELLACVDLLVVNEHEAGTLGRTGITTIVTHGADGACIRRGHRETAVPAPRGETVDTTGCGDALMGGLLTGLAEGLGLVTATHLGVAAGAYAAATPGAQPSYGTRTEVEALLRRQADA